MAGIPDFVTALTELFDGMVQIGKGVSDLAYAIITLVGLDKFIPPVLFQMIGTIVNFGVMVAAFWAFAGRAKLLFTIGGVIFVAFIINLFGLLNYFFHP